MYVFARLLPRFTSAWYQRRCAVSLFARLYGGRLPLPPHLAEPGAPPPPPGVFARARDGQTQLPRRSRECTLTTTSEPSSSETSPTEPAAQPAGEAAPKSGAITLAIDIGGTGIKCLLLDS